MIMPRLNGTETFDELKKYDPNVKVLMMSGFAPSNNIDSILAKGVAGFIAKPFKAKALLQMTSQIIADKLKS